MFSLRPNRDYLSIALTRIDANLFNDELRNVPWHVVENESNIDDTLLTSNKLFSEVADSHAPVKRRRVKGTPLLG